MSLRQRKLGEIPSIAVDFPLGVSPSVSPQVLVRDRYGNHRLVQSTDRPNIPTPYVRETWDPRRNVASLPSAVSIISGPERTMHPGRANHAGPATRGFGWGFGQRIERLLSGLRNRRR